MLRTSIRQPSVCWNTSFPISRIRPDGRCNRIVRLNGRGDNGPVDNLRVGQSEADHLDIGPVAGAVRLGQAGGAAFAPVPFRHVGLAGAKKWNEGKGERDASFEKPSHLPAKLPATKPISMFDYARQTMISRPTARVGSPLVEHGRGKTNKTDTGTEHPGTHRRRGRRTRAGVALSGLSHSNHRTSTGSVPSHLHAGRVSGPETGNRKLLKMNPFNIKALPGIARVQTPPCTPHAGQLPR